MKMGKLGTLFKDDGNVLRVFPHAGNLVQSILPFYGCKSVAALSEKTGHSNYGEDMSATALQNNDRVLLRRGKGTAKHSWKEHDIMT